MKRFSYLEVTFLAGQMKRDCLFGILGTDTRSMFQQERDKFRVSMQRSHMQGCKTILV